MENLIKLHKWFLVKRNKASLRFQNIIKNSNENKQEKLKRESLQYIKSSFDLNEINILFIWMHMKLYLQQNENQIIDLRKIALAIRSRFSFQESFIVLETWFPDKNDGLKSWNILDSYDPSLDIRRIGDLICMARELGYELFQTKNRGDNDE